MKRRSFLAASASAAGLSVIGGSGEQAAHRAGGDKGIRGKQVLDLRRYTFTSPDKRKTFEGFLAGGMVPALNRLGIRPVGAFTLSRADNPDAKFEEHQENDLFVLVPHPSLESAATLDARLAADSAYGAALAGLNDDPKDPAYARYESSLLLAFDAVPKVEVPTRAASRVLQLRIYEAHNAERSRRKVRMFNEGGEIAIFRAVGMNPVFFGHAFAGANLPNLTYLLAFGNAAAMKSAWDAFGKHPDWLKLKDDPLYRDTVSRITNLVLRPAEGSQV